VIILDSDQSEGVLEALLPNYCRKVNGLARHHALKVVTPLRAARKPEIGRCTALPASEPLDLSPLHASGTTAAPHCMDVTSQGPSTSSWLACRHKLQGNRRALASAVLGRRADRL
jgi:hypothetical protein